MGVYQDILRCQVILNNIIMPRFKLLNIGLSTLLGLVSSHYYVDDTGSQLYYPGPLTYQPEYYRQHASSVYATQPVHSTYQPVHLTYQPVDSTYRPVHSTYQPIPSYHEKDYIPIPHKADAGRSGRLFPYPIPLKKPGKDI